MGGNGKLRAARAPGGAAHGGIFMHGRKRGSWLAAAALLCGAAGASAETWYAQRISSGECVPLRIEDLWSRGAWLRAETVIGGRPIVTIVRGDRYITLDRLSDSGVSVKRHPNAQAADEPKGRPFGNELRELQRAGGERVGEEDLGGGAKCVLWRLTSNEGRTEVCTGEEESPRIFFVRRWDRASNCNLQWRYVQWLRNFEVKSGFFAAPAKARIESYSYEKYVQTLGQSAAGLAFPLLLHGPREE